MHRALLARGVSITERSVTQLMQRYEELVALDVTDHKRIKAREQQQGRVILAIDGLQPDVGHEVLSVVRDCLTVLFYAYDRHVYLALSTFSTLAIDGSIFLYLRWIPHISLLVGTSKSLSELLSA
jgi:hypothetical protein